MGERTSPPRWSELKMSNPDHCTVRFDRANGRATYFVALLKERADPHVAQLRASLALCAIELQRMYAEGSLT